MAKTVQDFLKEAEETKEPAEQAKILEEMAASIPGYRIEPPIREIDFDLYGKATAYGNNCAFHCLAEAIFHQLPDEKLQIIEQFPAFQGICRSFEQRYGMEAGTVNLAFLKQVNAQIIHPYDFQLIWGPVLRDAFYSEIPNLKDTDKSMSIYRNKDGTWKDGETVANDHLFKFVSALGGELEITAENPEDGFSPSFMREIYPDEYSSVPPFWKLDLKLERPGKEAKSGHYEFKVPPTLDHVQKQAERDAMLEQERLKGKRVKVDWGDGEVGYVQEEDTLGYLIPQNPKDSALETLSMERKGQRFHQITGRKGEDGTALRADILKNFVQKIVNTLSFSEPQETASRKEPEPRPKAALKVEPRAEPVPQPKPKKKPASQPKRQRQPERQEPAAPMPERLSPFTVFLQKIAAAFSWLPNFFFKEQEKKTVSSNLKETTVKDAIKPVNAGEKIGIKKSSVTPLHNAQKKKTPTVVTQSDKPTLGSGKKRPERRGPK